jgi:Leishmanolysin
LWVYVYGLASDYYPPCFYRGDSIAGREYRAISGCVDAVPLEESTSGSDCSHWEEFCFDNELMTPFLNSTGNPISRVTVGSLEDLGYTVDYSGADNYTTFNPACKCNRDPISTADDKTRRRIKRSLADAADDSVDTLAIAKAKDLLAAMMDEAATRTDAFPADDGSGNVTPPSNLWVSVVMYNVNMQAATSYIFTPEQFGWRV